MERPQEPLEGTVLDAEGRVLYEPNPSNPAGGAKHTRVGPEMKVAWGTGGPLASKTVGIVPKLIFGALFAGLLFLGLAVAGVLLGIVLVGWIARMTFSPKRR
jgi:hypothetical protein